MIFALVFVEVALLEHLFHGEFKNLVVEELVCELEALFHGLDLGIEVALYVFEL